MSESKRQKQHEIEHTNDMIDCISKLPDCIIHHILSFLPIKEVVKTSILSKRWKNLWASVPSLNLDETLWYAIAVGFQLTPELTPIMKFEERILRSQDAPKIEKIHIDCYECFNPSRISSWICKEVMCNVRELQLCLYGNDMAPFSQSIFDCKSLVSLVIEMQRDIEIPTYIYLPCLKILNISLVAFMNIELTEKLFSSCPVLEELALWNCAYGNNITISNLTLKKLTFIDQEDYHYTRPGGCKIKIYAKHLTHLEYSGYLADEILLNNVQSLVKACIDISLSDRRQKEVAYRAVYLLKSLQNVVFLSVSNCTLESLICADRMNLFPVFPNLTHLVLTTEIGNYTFGTFMYLLNFCPTLQSISLSEGFKSSMVLGENDLICLSIPICLSYHLKTLSFKNFHAYDSEIWFLKFVLKHALVLEKMNVRWCKPEVGDLKKQRDDVMKELKTTEKSYAACIFWN